MFFVCYGVQAERKTLYADMEELRRCGLDITSWKEGREYRYRLASREFELPEHLEPINILAIGYSNAGTADTSRFDRQRIALSQLVTYEK